MIKSNPIPSLVLVRMTAAIGVWLLFAAQPVWADDESANFANEKSGGFFQYFPAPKNLRLPSLDFVPFWTDDLKKARKAYKNGDYGKAMKFFRSESEDGNQLADWYLGHMYRLGQGVARDPAISYSYYQRSADAYYPDDPDPKRLSIAIDSNLQIADYDRTGIASAGLNADPMKAYRAYLRIATNHGHPAAFYSLGVMNIIGEGVSKNPAQGLKWLTAAARKRHAAAQGYLGDLYWDGKNVKKSESRALMWYILAAETAVPGEQSSIVARYQEMLSSVGEDTRLEAEARARVWAEQYPAELAQNQ